MYLNMHANYPLLLCSLAFNFFCSTNVLNLEFSFTTLLDQQSAKSYACGLSLMYWIAHCSICLEVNYNPLTLWCQLPVLSLSIIIIHISSSS